MLSPRRSMVGTVVSNKMQKTVVVQVETTRHHPIYGKSVRVRKKYKAHDENQSCREGDQVRIVLSRSLSKEKRWVVAEILRPAHAPRESK